MIKFTSWSPSRLADYRQCPAMARWKHLDKLCGECFQGRTGWEKPCDVCGKAAVKGPPLVRGTRLDESITAYLTGKSKSLDKEIVNPEVLSLLRECKASVRRKVGMVQKDLYLTRKWEPHVGKPWEPTLWARMTVDYMRIMDGHAHVIDWKSGGVDKRAGKPYDDDKYSDQLFAYAVGVLLVYPQAHAVSSELCFLDAREPHNALVNKPAGCLTRAGLHKAIKSWEVKLRAMLNDDVFSPKPGRACTWCPYARAKGGPCIY